MNLDYNPVDTYMFDLGMFIAVHYFFGLEAVVLVVLANLTTALDGYIVGVNNDLS